MGRLVLGKASHVPQGSVFGPLLFNITLYSKLDTCNHADDTTVYACDKNPDNVSNRLENDCSIALERFTHNGL